MPNTEIDDSGLASAIQAVNGISRDKRRIIGINAIRDDTLPLKVVYSCMDNPFVAEIYNETIPSRVRAYLSDAGINVTDVRQVKAAINMISRKK